MTHQHTVLCGELRGYLSDYLDGAVQEAVCREIEKHLAECPDCRVQVDTLKKTITLYRLAPREEVPAETHVRLWKVLELEMSH